MRLTALASPVHAGIGPGLEAAGELDGLQAYAALQALKNEAHAFEVPMSEIGLSGFDIDALLHKLRKVA